VRSPFLQAFADLPRELPIFPLSGAVVLPGVQLPLNIFEPRYLNMVAAALAQDHLIGMVQPRADADAAEPPPVHRIGCAGRITSYSETTDGRIVMVLTGLCRFEIVEELPEHDGFRRIRPDWSRFSGDYDLDGGSIGDRERFMGSLRAFCDQRSVEVPRDRHLQAPRAIRQARRGRIGAVGRETGQQSGGEAGEDGQEAVHGRAKGENGGREHRDLLRRVNSRLGRLRGSKRGETAPKRAN